MTNYIEILSRKYPNVQAHVQGDLDNYDNLVYDAGDPLPSKEELDSAYLACVKEDQWAAIKLLRDTRKAAGVKVQSYWFHSDDPSRIQQIALMMLGQNLPEGLMWKTMTGEFVLMTPSLASDVFFREVDSDTTIFAIAENHRQAMLASEDPANYDFTGGWPMSYTESPEYVPH